MRLAGLPDAWPSTGSRSPGSGRSPAPRSPRRGGRRRRCRCRQGGGRDADAARPGLLAGGPSPGGMVLGSVPGRDAVPCRGRSRAEDRRDDRRRRGAAHTRRPRTYSSGAGRLRGERVGGSGARRLPPRDPVNRRDLPHAGRASRSPQRCRRRCVWIRFRSAASSERLGAARSGWRPAHPLRAPRRSPRALRGRSGFARRAGASCRARSDSEREAAAQRCPGRPRATMPANERAGSPGRPRPPGP